MAKICPDLTGAKIAHIEDQLHWSQALTLCIGKECGKYNLCNGIHLTAPSRTWAGAGIREITQDLGEQCRGRSAAEILEANRKAAKEAAGVQPCQD